MSGWRGLAFAALFALPAIPLAASGWLQLQDGLALDAAFPVPINLSTNNPMLKPAYAAAAAALAHADHRDGAARIWLAEADAKAGGGGAGEIIQGLAAEPASAEGWTVYGEMLAASQPQKAAHALNEALSIAPFDYFWAGRRAALGARIWGALDGDTRARVVRQVQRLWRETAMRDQMQPLLATPEGRSLMARTYAGDPATVKAIARWTLVRRLQIQSGAP